MADSTKVQTDVKAIKAAADAKKIQFRKAYKMPGKIGAAIKGGKK